MVRNLAHIVGGLAVAVVSLLAVSVRAQDAVLAEFYGAGVHQYFSGNSDAAIASLTTAIDGGTKDPRAYYFRALAELRQGQSDMAELDMAQGAALESADVNQFYPVAKSLERVQGSARRALERHRVLARAESHQKQVTRNAIRYEQRRKAESQVLRAPATMPAPAGVPAPPKPGMVVPPSAPAPKPAVADEDPFAEPETPAAKAPAAAPADEMPEEKAPAAKDAGDDPFADPPSDDAGDKEEMPADDAKGSDAPAADADPFADDKEPEAAGDAKDVKPEAAEEDPFK